MYQKLFLNIFYYEQRPPGQAPDLSFYSQQLAEQLGGSDKGPSGPSFLPEHFQYMQASTGPVGQRGPQGLCNFISDISKLQLI